MFLWTGPASCCWSRNAWSSPVGVGNGACGEIDHFPALQAFRHRGGRVALRGRRRLPPQARQVSRSWLGLLDSSPTARKRGFLRKPSLALRAGNGGRLTESPIPTRKRRDKPRPPQEAAVPGRPARRRVRPSAAGTAGIASVRPGPWGPGERRRPAAGPAARRSAGRGRGRGRRRGRNKRGRRGPDAGPGPGRARRPRRPLRSAHRAAGSTTRMRAQLSAGAASTALRSRQVRAWRTCSTSANAARRSGVRPTSMRTRRWSASSPSDAAVSASSDGQVEPGGARRGRPGELHHVAQDAVDAVRLTDDGLQRLARLVRVALEPARPHGRGRTEPGRR